MKGDICSGLRSRGGALLETGAEETALPSELATEGTPEDPFAVDVAWDVEVEDVRREGTEVDTAVTLAEVEAEVADSDTLDALLSAVSAAGATPGAGPEEGCAEAGETEAEVVCGVLPLDTLSLPERSLPVCLLDLETEELISSCSLFLSNSG